MTALYDVREEPIRPGTETNVPRRYCSGKATVSDGNTYPIYYMLTEYGGFLGFGWNVEACINALDKWRINDGDCRGVKPYDTWRFN
ncbi:hypothetical protein E1297_19230 [Roseibium sp. RKSG952]|nr:hypothetical protein [Roseibium sp. RKSG952]